MKRITRFFIGVLGALTLAVGLWVAGWGTAWRDPAPPASALAELSAQTVAWAPYLRPWLARRLAATPADDPALWLYRALESLSDPALAQVLDALLPPTQRIALVERTVPQVWSWLQHAGGRTPELDLTPWRDGLTQGVVPALDALLRALPPCTTEDLARFAAAALSAHWERAPLCRPPQAVRRALDAEAQRQAARLVALLPKAVPYTALLSGDALARLRAVVLLTAPLGWALALLGGGVLALAAWRWGGGGWRGLSWLGGGALLAGGVLFGLSQWTQHVVPTVPGAPRLVLEGLLGVWRGWLQTAAAVWRLATLGLLAGGALAVLLGWLGRRTV